VSGDRIRLGALGEVVAARFLTRRGGLIVARNVVVGGGEIDLVVRWADGHAAVEVRTIGPDAIQSDPVERISQRKLAQVRRLAGLLTPRYGPMRVDFVGVVVDRSGVVVRWLANVA